MLRLKLLLLFFRIIAGPNKYDQGMNYALRQDPRRNNIEQFFNNANKQYEIIDNRKNEWIEWNWWLSIVTYLL